MLSLGSYGTPAQVGELVSAGQVMIRRRWCYLCSRPEDKRERELSENGSAGAFIPSVTAQRSTGNERLRASNQEPPGHHVTRDTPMGCYCTALSKT